MVYEMSGNCEKYFTITLKDHVIRLFLLIDKQF